MFCYERNYAEFLKKLYKNATIDVPEIDDNEAETISKAIFDYFGKRSQNCVEKRVYAYNILIKTVVELNYGCVSACAFVSRDSSSITLWFLIKEFNRNIQVILANYLNMISELTEYGAFVIDEYSGFVKYVYSYNIENKSFCERTFRKYLVCCLSEINSYYEELICYCVGHIPTNAKKKFLKMIRETLEEIS